MAVKFPLEMKDGVKVRNISEFKEHFDIENAIGYFLDGRLKKWLDDRWYEEESEQISKLDANNSNLAQALSEIFGIEYKEDKVNLEEIAAKNKRIAKLKQYTDNEKIIKNIESVAFDQEELAELYDQGIEKIYLCEGEFVIPKSKKDLNYELIGDVSVTGIESEEVDEDQSENTLYIQEALVIDGSQKYEDAQIYIGNVIKCSGSLEFENCEIYCDSVKNSDSYVIYVNMGRLSFKNCKLYVSLGKNVHFIGGRDSKVLIKDCSINNPKNLIGEMYRGNLVLEDSELSSVFYPIIKSYIKELTMSRCKILGSANKHDLSKKVLESREWFLFGQVDEALVNECTFSDIPQGIFSVAKKVTLDRTNFDRCQAILYRVDNAVLRNSTFDSCVHPFIDSCRQHDETLSLFNCKFINCLGEIKAGNLKAEDCLWDKGFISIKIPRYSNSSNGISFFNCIFKNISAGTLRDFIKTCNIQKYISNDEFEESYNQMEVFIDAGISGEMNACTFANVVMENQKYLVSCRNYMKISNCNFKDCLTKREILDREERTIVDLNGGFLGIFNKEYKTKPTYSITNCVGIY